jgi:hypothetical protein
MAVTGDDSTPNNETGRRDETLASSRLPRRPYHKPVLRPLGSVRDLTFGSVGGPIIDAMGGRSMMFM